MTHEKLSIVFTNEVGEDVPMVLEHDCVKELNLIIKQYLIKCEEEENLNLLGEYHN